jgi:hypothetical protein
MNAHEMIRIVLFFGIGIALPPPRSTMDLRPFRKAQRQSNNPAGSGLQIRRILVSEDFWEATVPEAPFASASDR